MLSLFSSAKWVKLWYIHPTIIRPLYHQFSIDHHLSETYQVGKEESLLVESGSLVTNVIDPYLTIQKGRT
jgi:hypothetical protein